MRSLARQPRAAALIPVVSRLGYSQDELPHRYEQILPGGGQHLMINLHEDSFWAYDGGSPLGAPRGRQISGIGFGGASIAPTVADTRNMHTILSVQFTFGGAYAFFGCAAAEATGQFVDLEDLWGAPARRLRERLLEVPTREARMDLVETLLLDRHRRSPTTGTDPDIDPAIEYAVKALEHGTAVATVVDDLGWTSKRFVRHFTNRIGLTPKRFARVRRLQRVLLSVEGIGDPDWARVACEHGFFDQAHFVNDFKALTGITPTAYTPRSPNEHNHLPLPG